MPAIIDAATAADYAISIFRAATLPPPPIYAAFLSISLIMPFAAD
jgi:hypothetical protein